MLFVLRFLVKHWDKVVLASLITLYIVTLGTLSVLRHNAFASNFDLSNMDHTIWNTLYGNFFSLRFHDNYVSRLSVHADFILILLTPLYLIWDNVRILLISQSVFLGIGALPTYLLAYRILKDKLISLTIVAIYLLNPQMMWTNIYDFHPVALVVPFFLFAFYFALTKRWIWYWIFVFLAILTKENQSLNIAMMGVVIFFVLRQRAVGAATFVGGVCWFVLMVFVIMPHFSANGVHWALADYEQDLPSLVTNSINPINLFYLFVLDSKSHDYYHLLLKPYSYISLIGFPALVLSIPSLVINVLRDTRSINFHYGTGLIPGLTISAILGLKYISEFLEKLRIKNPRIILYALCFGMVLYALRTNYHYSPLPTTPSCWCLIYRVSEEDLAFENALQNIPKDASVTASLEVRPHVNHRKNVWFVPSATESARFIALIRQNRIVGNYEPKDYENRLIPVLLSSKEHRVAFRSEHFYLFERINQTN